MQKQDRSCKSVCDSRQRTGSDVQQAFDQSFDVAGSSDNKSLSPSGSDNTRKASPTYFDKMRQRQFSRQSSVSQSDHVDPSSKAQMSMPDDSGDYNLSYHLDQLHVLSPFDASVGSHEAYYNPLMNQRFDYGFIQPMQELIPSYKSTPVYQQSHATTPTRPRPATKQRAPSHSNMRGYFGVEICGYCKSSKQGNPRGHNKYNCPVLKTMPACALCGADGLNNHTSMYCPTNKTLLKLKLSPEESKKRFTQIQEMYKQHK